MIALKEKSENLRFSKWATCRTDKFIVMMAATKILCRSLRKTRPPYKCPNKECGKSYKSFTGMKVHLYKSHCDISRDGDKGKDIFDGLSVSQTKNIGSNDAVKCTADPSTFKIDMDGHVSYFKSSERTPVVNPEDLDKNGFKDSLSSLKMYKYSYCASPKLPDSNVRLVENRCPPCAPQLPSSYYKLPNGLYDELYKEVEYDMDDEDVIWLQLMNDQLDSHKLNKVSEDTFELYMDRFEKASFVHAQKVAEDALASLDEDAVCSICNDGECDDSNAILFCDQCNLPVHQECYGVPFIPEGQWLCKPCSQSSTSSLVECVLCPNKGGALKPTNDNRWAHVICALWIPEVGFTNPDFLEPIDSIPKIPRARWKLTCYICKRRNVGACIQCKKSSCYTAFHVTCAQNKGLFMEMKAVRPESGSSTPYEIKKSAFCHLHTPKEACSEESSHDYSSVTADQKKQTLTELTVPVTSIPDIAPYKLTEIAKSFDIPVERFFFEKLFGYWKLKRQARGGAPLLRHLQITLHSRQKESSVTNIAASVHSGQLDVKQLRKVRQDFEKARLLLEMIRKREKLKKRLIQIKEKETLLKLQPFKAVLLTVLESLQKKDLNQIFFQPVDLTVAPDYLDFIKNPMDFSTMKSKIQRNQYTSFRQFAADFNLIIDNCLFYNSPETIYHKIALEVKEQCLPILQSAKNEILRKGLDPTTGLFQEHIVPQTPKFLPKNELMKTKGTISATKGNQNHRHRKHLRDDFNYLKKSCKLRKTFVKTKSLPKSSRVGISESDEENGFHDRQFLRKGMKRNINRFRSNTMNVIKKCQRNSYKFKFQTIKSKSCDSLPVNSTNTSVPNDLPPICADANFSPSICHPSDVENCALGDSVPLKVPMTITPEVEYLEGQVHEKQTSVDRQLRRKKLT